MMRCPFCDFENLEGADFCTRCQVDLSDMAGESDNPDIEQDLLHQSLMTIASKDYVEVSPQGTVAETVRQWNEGGHHCAIVVDGGSVVGIFTERDVLYKLADQFERCGDHPVSDYMTKNPEILQHDAPLAFALNRMMIGGYRHIPIERHGSLVGVVNVRNILTYLVQQHADVFSA